MKILVLNTDEDFPDGPGVKYPPSNEGDEGSSFLLGT